MPDLASFGGRWAPFVFGAYGAAALLFAWMIADTLILARRQRRAARRLEAESGR